LLLCLAVALGAFSAAFAFASFRVVRAAQRVLAIFEANGESALGTSDVLAGAPLALGFAALIGAAALAIAGWRAALALERASLIETAP
jgi:hypothetical protein